jgi:hypothetical protein
MVMPEDKKKAKAFWVPPKPWEKKPAIIKPIPLQSLPDGYVTSLDVTLKGGFPVGHISKIWGREAPVMTSSGKSMLGFQILKQRWKNPAKKSMRGNINLSPKIEWLKIEEARKRGYLEPEPAEEVYFEADGIKLLPDGAVEIRCEACYDWDDCLFNVEMTASVGPSRDKHWFGYMLENCSLEEMLDLTWSDDDGVWTFLGENNIAPGQVFWLRLTYIHSVTCEGEHDEEVDWEVFDIEELSKEEIFKRWAPVYLNERLTCEGQPAYEDARFNGIG